jgi:phosphate:Na+ symporter
MAMDNIELLFKFIGGLGMFLYGMNVMADGLQKSAGNKMKQLLGFLTNNRFVAVIVGALITAIIQSSSGTTVMIVGFVNAGIINLTQAVGVIMGANIGTTVTAWIVSMSEWGSILKPEFFAPLIIGIGVVLTMFSKAQKKKEIGEILVGFGVLFIGLSFMSGAITPYRDAPIFVKAFTVLGSNPLLGILAGAGVTAVIQSSSASVGILQTLAINGIVNWRSAIFITLGQNIGTCVTALISSAGAHRTAKRAAVIHLLFNVIGSILFGIIMFVVFQFNKGLATSAISSVQISIFHTIFNVSNTLILFPFANTLVNISGKLIKKSTEKEFTQMEELMIRLDDRILETPSFAIETAEDEVVHMGNIALDSVRNSVKALLDNDMESLDKVLKTEKMINKFETILTEYMVKINNLSLNETQHLKIKNLLYTISDIERVGDHSENLAELAKGKIEQDIKFSGAGYEDMKEICESSIKAFEAAIQARATGDIEYVREVMRYEDMVDDLEDELREKHIQRLSKNLCLTSSGVIFLDAISNVERISDHAYNIAGYVKDEY